MPKIATRRVLTRAELKMIPLPPKTETYTPTSYTKLIQLVEFELGKLNVGIVGESIETTKDGQQMLAILDLNTPIEDPDFRKILGIRSSYNGSLRNAIMFGIRIVSTDTVTFDGELLAFRKHTGSSLGDLPEMISIAIRDGIGKSSREIDFFPRLKHLVVQEDERNKILIDCMAKLVITSSQIKKVFDRFNTIDNGTAFDLYNSILHCFKEANPIFIPEMSVELDKIITETYYTVLYYSSQA